ncbi:MAG: hypothetical protein JWP31_1719 [Aeromicrobium sp.]|nr:hypothetical protein [Aeromicrobium sp.]
MRTLEVDGEALGDKPDLSSSTDEPSHARIAAWLMQGVASGRIQTDDKLPPEEELASSLGVSRMTLRQALGSLEAQGWVERKRGRAGGSFIREPKVAVDLTGLPGFTEQMRRANLRAGARVIRAGIVDAPAEVADALGLGRDRAAIEIVRVRSARRQPLALEETYLPARLFPGLLERNLGGSIYELMRQHYGLGPAGAREWLEPEIVSDEHADLLGLDRGSAVMLVTRRATTAAGVAVEFAYDRYRSDRTRISLQTGLGASTTISIEPA